MPTSPDREDNRGDDWALFRKQLGRRIHRLRKARKLSQEALALECGLSRNMLIYIEHGTHGIMAERLADIADALGVSLAALVDNLDSELKQDAASEPPTSAYEAVQDIVLPPGETVVHVTRHLRHKDILGKVTVVQPMRAPKLRKRPRDINPN